MDLRRREEFGVCDRVRLNSGAKRCGEEEDARVGREEEKSWLTLTCLVISTGT